MDATYPIHQTLIRMTHPQAHLSHPKYRPDIDGLRAIAVLAVLGFHAFPELVTGGFIGVDIFFVISGYLISTILIESLKKNRFSLWEFYSRRIRRIFPALTFVLSTSLIIGWFVLFADEYKQLGRQTIGGAGFISNLILWRDSGYFDVGVELKPLLHLWSLGIEEQFYFVWPLLLYVGYRFKWNLLYLTGVLATLSFALNVANVNTNPVATFYSPQTRFWELLIGSGLAYCMLHRSAIAEHFISKHSNYISAIGITLLGLGILLTNSQSAFPGWWALLPTVGATLVISAKAECSVNKTFLSNKPIVFIGLISFPLYLWHWPALSFIYILNGGLPPVWARISAVVLSFALAWITYQFIEKPIRQNKQGAFIVPSLLMLMLLIFCSGTYIYAKEGMKSRLINTPFASLDNHSFSASRQSDQSCLNKLNLKTVPEEVCITNSTAPQTLFVGDSHAMALFAASNQQNGKQDIQNAMLIAGHACLPYANLDRTSQSKSNWANNCSDIANEALRVAKSLPSIKTVVMVNRLPNFTEDAQSNYQLQGLTLNASRAFQLGNEDFISKLLEEGKRVIYVADVPILKAHPNQCETRLSFVSPKNCQMSEQALREERAIYLENVQELKKKFPKIVIYDPINTLCTAGVCNGKTAGEYMYFDDNHLNSKGSELILNELNQLISTNN